MKSQSPDLGWVVVGDYGLGEEVVCFCETKKEAQQILGDYLRSVPNFYHRLRPERDDDQ